MDQLRDEESVARDRLIQYDATSPLIPYIAYVYCFVCYSTALAMPYHKYGTCSGLSYRQHKTNPVCWLFKRSRAKAFRM